MKARMLNPPHDSVSPPPSPETDLWLPYDVFAPLQRLVQAALTHYEEIDPSIMMIDLPQFQKLQNILDNAGDDGKTGGRNLRLNNVNMAAFEQLSFYAEEFFGDLGGEKDLQMTPPDITALTEKLRSYRIIAFPI